MKYNKIENQVKDMTEIFKESGKAFALSHSNQWPKNADLISVQTGDQ